MPSRSWKRWLEICSNSCSNVIGTVAGPSPFHSALTVVLDVSLLGGWSSVGVGDKDSELPELWAIHVALKLFLSAVRGDW